MGGGLTPIHAGFLGKMSNYIYREEIAITRKGMMLCPEK